MVKSCENILENIKQMWTIGSSGIISSIIRHPPYHLFKKRKDGERKRKEEKNEKKRKRKEKAKKTKEKKIIEKKRK